MTNAKGTDMIGKNEAVSKACVDRITEYWAKKGYSVSVDYESKRGEDTPPLYPLRSDMKNGLPKGARWRA